MRAPPLPIAVFTPSARGGPHARPLTYGLCLGVAGGGVILAVAGLLRLSLPLMLAGTVLWLLGGVVWELATGRFR